MHSRFCSNPAKSFNMMGIPKKATTLKEHNSYEAERIRKVHNGTCGLGTPAGCHQYLSIWINITIPEHNQEATLYLQELTSTLPIRRLIQVHLTGNTSHDYQGFPRFLSIYKFPLTISYCLLCITGHHVSSPGCNRYRYNPSSGNTSSGG